MVELYLLMGGESHVEEPKRCVRKWWCWHRWCGGVGAFGMECFPMRMDFPEFGFWCLCHVLYVAAMISHHALLLLLLVPLWW